MKKRRPCLPRKMLKAMNTLLIDPDTGNTFFNGYYRMIHYPRTKWVVRAERQFRRLWRENRRLKGLEA